MTSIPAQVLRLADLAKRGETEIDFTPDAAGRAAVAEALGIRGLRKLRLTGRLRPAGRHDWHLAAHLGATVVQDCVVTLDPVTTRIEEDLERHYLADLPLPDGGAEIEMPEDETAEPLPAEIDLAQVATEALALALPPYPRAEGAELGAQTFAAPGVAPMSEDESRPFAGLAGLRDRLGTDGEDDGNRGGGG